MHTTIFSATTVGVEAYLVQVEVDLSFGMLQFFIVGLPDTAIKESRQRIQTALKNSGIRLPERKITVNLAPADLKKEGTTFDLPIAVGLLQAAQLIQVAPSFLQETLIVGELSLDGSIRSVKGILAIAYDAQRLGKKRLIVPQENAQEAAFIKELEIIGVNNVVELTSYLRGENSIAPTVCSWQAEQQAQINTSDFAQVKGQQQAKRALQIAAAGKHNILFIGPPGSGKTMLAQRLPTIMPTMTFDEMLATSKIYSVCGKLQGKTLLTQRPFRNPHHTISQAGLVGGGSFPQPGEISLAHHGILFLDELTEFKRTTLEVLRQPLEQRTVSIARANQTVNFPSSFLLVAALNPCPCGYLGDKKRQCRCSKHQINAYLDKLSGPLLDRIDLQIAVQAVDYETVANPQAQSASSSAELYQPVALTLQRQVARQKIQKGVANALLTPDQIEQLCVVSPEAKELVKTVFEKLRLSMRGYHKLLKVARTIADLDDQDIIGVSHIQEAMMYRSLDAYLEKIRS